MVSEEQIQDIIDKTDMVELVGEFVHLEKTGANYKGLCPFHNENTPSFVVSPQKKRATCFGCNKSLNPIAFIQEIKNMPFVDALAYVANKANVKIDLSTKNKDNKPNFSKYYNIMENANSFYTKNLFETKGGLQALDYLHKRGLDDETIKMFDIGLAPQERDTIYKMLSDLGFFELDMLACGLIKSNDDLKNVEYYDLFTKRIMFPIKDISGNIIGFSGRIYSKEDINSPKYINSPETIIFKKHLNLFNLNNAIPDIRKNHRVILYEGQMDVIASTRAGFKESVCSLGTALTREQCQLIKKYTDNVIICYDSDDAGLKASLRAIDLLKSNGLNVKLMHLEGAKDADEYILKYGPQKYKEYFEKNIISEVDFRFLCAIHNRNLDEISDIEIAKKEIFDILLKEHSQTLVEMYLNKFALLCNVSYSSLIIDYNSYCNTFKVSNNVEIRPQDKNSFNNFNESIDILSKYKTCELRLFKYACISKDNALYIDSSIDISSFEKVHQDLWFELIDSYYNYYEVFNLDKFLGLISGVKNLFNVFVNDTKVLNKLIEIEYSDLDMRKCIKVFNEQKLIRQIKELDESIKNEIDDLKKLKLVNEKLLIKREIEKNKRKQE